MLGLTKYIALNGYDLSLIFQHGSSTIITGFSLLNGDDIGSVFEPYSTGSPQAPPTGLISVGGGGYLHLI